LLGKIAGVTFAIAAFSVMGWAQLPTGGNVFFGYSYSRGQTVSTLGIHGAGMNGWEASAQGKFLPWLSAVADFDWHYGGTDAFGCFAPACVPKKFRLNASRHVIVFGPRASVTYGRYTPFAEFLLGFAHQTDTGGGFSNSDTSFSTALGGGLDYKLVKGVAWRVQGDDIRTKLFGSTQNDLRISTGIVFKF
jgi:opacity protein-like surface antigen